MEDEVEKKVKAPKKYKLRMKKLPEAVPVPTAIWPKPEHLPPIAIKEKRGKVFVGEIFEVNSKEEAEEYLNNFWFVEMVP